MNLSNWRFSPPFWSKVGLIRRRSQETLLRLQITGLFPWPMQTAKRTHDFMDLYYLERQCAHSQATSDSDELCSSEQ
jgi:hypothetical protein